MRRAILFACFILVAASPTRAQVTPDALATWGTTFASDCAKPSSPRVTVSERSIVYVEGGKRVEAKNANGTATWFGESAPDDYVFTFLGDMADGDQLIVNVFQAKGQTWAKIDGGVTVQKMLGKTALGRRYARCASTPATKAEAPGQPSVKPEPAPSTSGLPSAADYALDPEFAAPYKKALGKYSGEHWLLTLQGQSPPTKRVTIAGTEYVVIATCKDQDCADNNTTLLWNEAKKTVFGKVRVAGKSALVGKPPKEVQRDLGELWWRQWASTP